MELMRTHGGIFGFPASFQFLWASLAFKTSLNTFSHFAETHLVISEKLSSQTLWFFAGRGLLRWSVCSGAPNFPPFKVRFPPLLLFHFVSMSIRAMVSSILISSFSFLFGFAGDLVCPSMVSSSVVRTECPSISFLFARLGNMGIMS